MPLKSAKSKGRRKSHGSGKKSKSLKTKSVNAKPATDEIDILGPVAMENVYYIAHNVADCLVFRGFQWPDAPKKKGKRGKKKK
ncbi:small lysine-rich protein 1 [Latimeria chalumnae]|uniref:small lysine-rich protein 1 n=1 Tax=Latimeria chalumnae TaxID=7897 RepID=UPI00313D7065